MNPLFKPFSFETIVEADGIAMKKTAEDFIVDAATLAIVKRYLLHNKTFVDRAELMAIIGISDPVVNDNGAGVQS
jgi:hypothetical protein